MQLMIRDGASDSRSAADAPYRHGVQFATTQPPVAGTASETTSGGAGICIRMV
jgi:hypothetical protein